LTRQHLLDQGEERVGLTARWFCAGEVVRAAVDVLLGYSRDPDESNDTMPV